MSSALSNLAAQTNAVEKGLGAKGFGKALKVNGVRMAPHDVGAMWFGGPNHGDLAQAEKQAARLKNSAGGRRTTEPSEVRAAAQRNLVRPTAKEKRVSRALKDADRHYVGFQGFGKAFATRDQNSSVPTSTSWGKTDSRLRSATLRGTERGNAGSGRKGVLTTKDQNSSPKVQWVQPRHRETGRFVSHENDLKIFRPAGRTGRHEGPSGKLGHYTKSPTRVAHGVRKSLDLPGNGKVGRRLA